MLFLISPKVVKKVYDFQWCTIMLNLLALKYIDIGNEIHHHYFTENTKYYASKETCHNILDTLWI